jgi:hypothetical protein
MARPPEKLAQSLEILRNIQTAEGAGAIRARDISRTHRERLLRNGFLQEVREQQPRGIPPPRQQPLLLCWLTGPHAA